MLDLCESSLCDVILFKIDLKLSSSIILFDFCEAVVVVAVVVVAGSGAAGLSSFLTRLLFWLRSSGSDTESNSF